MPTPLPPEGQEQGEAPAGGAAAEEAPQQEPEQQEQAEPMEESREEGGQEDEEEPALPPTAATTPAVTAVAPAPTPAIPSSGLKRGPRSGSSQPPRRPSVPPAAPAEVAPSRLSARQAAKRQRQAVAALTEEADEKTAAELLLGMQSLSNSQGDSDSPTGDQHATADHPPRPPSGRKHQLPAIPAPAPAPAPAPPSLPSKVSTSSLAKTGAAPGSSALATPDLPRVPSQATSGQAAAAAPAAAAAASPTPAPAAATAAAAEPKWAPTPVPPVAAPAPAPDAAAAEAAAAAAAEAAAAEAAAAAAAAAAEAAGLRRSARPKKDKSMGGDFSTGEEASGEDTHSEDEYAPTSGHRMTGPRGGVKASSATLGVAAAAVAPGAAVAAVPAAAPAPAAAAAAPPAAAVPAAATGPPASGVERAPGGSGTITTLVPQKSELTLLCERFQQQFGHLQPDGSPTLLMLNDVAEVLGVPRRRLYDVINVFESIEVMRRVGKLMYEWMGFDHLPSLLEQLAAEEESGVPVEDRIRRAPTIIIVNEQGEELGSSKANSHSLWVLSRRLVRMLLKHEGPIALTSAAAILVGPGGVSDPSQHRSQTQITVERRLYDIGSILCSIGLIARIYVKKRQPAFEWTFGWKPGDSHPPPKLANSYAPTEGLILNKAPAGLASAARKRPATSRAGGFTPQHLLLGGTGHPSGSKRHKGAATASGGLKISGLVPIDAFGMGGMGGMMMMHPGAFMMAPGGAMGGMGGMGMGMPLMGMQAPSMLQAAAAAAGGAGAPGAGDKAQSEGAGAAGGAAGAGGPGGLPGAAMFFPPHGAFFANPMALGMGGMLNPAALALQQAQQVMGGMKPELGGGEDGESSAATEAAAAAIQAAQAAQQQQTLAAIRAAVGLPPESPLDLGSGVEASGGEMSIAALTGGTLAPVPALNAGVPSAAPLSAPSGSAAAVPAEADLATATTVANEAGQAAGSNASGGEEAAGPGAAAVGGEDGAVEQLPAKDTEMAEAVGPAAAAAAPAGEAAAPDASVPAAVAGGGSSEGGKEGGGSRSDGESEGGDGDGKAAPSAGTAPMAAANLFQQTQQLAGMHPAMMGMYQMHPQMAQMAGMGMYPQMLMPGGFMMPSMAGMAGMAMPGAATAAAAGGTPGARKPGAGAAAAAPGQQGTPPGAAGQMAALQYVPMMQYGAGGMPMLLSTMAQPPAAPQ